MGSMYYAGISQSYACIILMEEFSKLLYTTSCGGCCSPAHLLPYCCLCIQGHPR